tara:strand:+ start:153 stop:302 length:150 start_codon:yes stop_codon:yes gene_type:complete
MKKKFKYDGKSRPATELYKKEFDRIFGKNEEDKEKDNKLTNKKENKDVK